MTYPAPVNLPIAPRSRNVGVPVYTNGGLFLLDTLKAEVSLDVTYNDLLGTTEVNFIVPDPLAEVWYTFGDPIGFDDQPSPGGDWILWDGLPFDVSSVPVPDATLFYLTRDDVNNRSRLYSENLFPGILVLYGYNFEAGDAVRIYRGREWRITIGTPIGSTLVGAKVFVSFTEDGGVQDDWTPFDIADGLNDPNDIADSLYADMTSAPHPGWRAFHTAGTPDIVLYQESAGGEDVWTTQGTIAVSASGVNAPVNLDEARGASPGTPIFDGGVGADNQPIIHLGANLSIGDVKNVFRSGNYYIDLYDDEVPVPGVPIQQTVPQRFKVELNPTVNAPAGFNTIFTSSFENYAWRRKTRQFRFGDQMPVETIVAGDINAPVGSPTALRPGTIGRNFLQVTGINSRSRFQLWSEEELRSQLAEIWVRSANPGTANNVLFRMMARRKFDTSEHYRANIRMYAGSAYQASLTFWRDGVEYDIGGGEVPLNIITLGEWLGLRFHVYDDPITSRIRLDLYASRDNVVWTILRQATRTVSSLGFDYNSMFRQRGWTGLELAHAGSNPEGYELDDWRITI